jgi:hypothetical protein
VGADVAQVGVTRGDDLQKVLVHACSIARFTSSSIVQHD